MKFTRLFPIVAILLASCSPKVVTDLVKTYPNPIPTDSVWVIELGDPMPNSAETIGRVSVVDRGTSTKCRYDEVVHLAREATGKAGGNGLAITDHREPSLWGSSCHQISGLMLHLSDREVDTLKVNPVQDMISLNLAVAKNERAKRRAPANTFEASVGYGWVTSKLYDLNNRSVGSKGGVEWKLGYEHIWSAGWGVGVQYSGFKATFPEGDMVLSYLAPEFAGRTKFDKWILKYGVGIGLLLYHEPFYSSAGFGTHLTLGVEYMVTKQVGLAVSANTVSASLPERDGVQLNKNERNGIGRFNLLGGLRVYL